ncbi:low affinity immunoglobulin gamma Fc region receptor III-like [Archocentrus centrarchus]|uniref:low affinity immunoglobulin gamma Fc region receptor III-like n=1 Tax=Archocentrus centrarchus TaxID=63155 RepID=UPI0011EA3625|nr:low affinity immunoglobulin gamma Fc region receptor III-like [Archocentrus centrarchus]
MDELTVKKGDQGVLRFDLHGNQDHCKYGGLSHSATDPLCALWRLKICLGPVADVLVLMAVQADDSNFAVSGAVSLHIVPNKVQFFEYESVSVRCEADNSISEWSVKWKPHKITNSTHTSNTSASPYSINLTFEKHSGEYWCENEDGERSEAVNITVTAGFVILESPTHPVIEGNEVTFNCTNKKTQSGHITDFYKDGVPLGTWYNSSMTIQNVSKSHEGFYKCSISGAGESPERWLAVLKQSEAPYKEIDLSHSLVPKTPILLWTVASALLVALLVVVICLLLHKKYKVLQEENTSDPHHVTYAVVRKKRKQKDGDNSKDPDDVLYATVKTDWKKKEPKMSRADIRHPCFQEETVIYSSVRKN